MPNQNTSVILATGGYDHVIKFWEASTGNYYRAVQFTESQVNVLQITPDKKYLFAAGNPHIAMFDTGSSNNNPVRSFDGHTSNVTSVGFPRREVGDWFYTASEDGTMRIFDSRASSGSSVIENVNKVPINTAGLHPNQKELILGDNDGNVRVWDIVASKWVMEACPQTGVPVQSLSVGLDGRLVAIANNLGNCFLWNPFAPETFESSPEHTLSTATTQLHLHDTYILKCQISPDRKWLATASADRTVKLWNVNNHKELKLAKTLAKHQRWVHDCVFSADSSYLVTACSDLSAYLWDLSKGDMIRHYSHEKAVTAVALNDSSIE